MKSKTSSIEPRVQTRFPVPQHHPRRYKAPPWMLLLTNDYFSGFLPSHIMPIGSTTISIGVIERATSAL
uniref:Uncharacterized protein n=1 Tax=Rhodococcus hoagii TaxID=43767 RepID=A0A1Z1UYT6_RHOHA|nr:hypothetical protein pVAPB1533_0461 [Prescottella equi]